MSNLLSKKLLKLILHFLQLFFLYSQLYQKKVWCNYMNIKYKKISELNTSIK